MNNKGFAITGIIYGLMVLFVFILSSFLAVVVGKNKRSEELTKSVYDSIMVDVKNVHSFNSALSEVEKFDKDSLTYVTSERAKYVFYNDDETVCGEVYLPKGIEIKINEDGKAIYNTTNKIEGCNYNVCPNTLEFDYTGGVQTFTVTCPGKYKLEVWGAQGGYGLNDSSTSGAKGGYSYGTISLKTSDIVYVQVGEAGKKVTSKETNGAYNGGGSYNSSYCNFKNLYNDSILSGGGATDIRIKANTLYNRVIVAGGGGGGMAYWNYDVTDIYTYSGGVGGGAISGPTVGHTTYFVEKSATQTTGYSFGIGEGACGAEDTSYKYDYWAGSGGGGWYGGFAGGGIRSSVNFLEGLSAGSGGSGWIYTKDAYDTWCAGDATNCASWDLNNDYYLTEAATIAGNQSFTDHDGTTVTGHSGNGYARITYLDY